MTPAHARPPRFAVAPPRELGRLYTIPMVAERLLVSVHTVRRMLDRGTIRAVRIGHGRGLWRISEVEVQRVIDEGTSLG